MLVATLAPTAAALCDMGFYASYTKVYSLPKITFSDLSLAPMTGLSTFLDFEVAPVTGLSSCPAATLVKPISKVTGSSVHLELVQSTPREAPDTMVALA